MRSNGSHHLLFVACGKCVPFHCSRRKLDCAGDCHTAAADSRGILSAELAWCACLFSSQTSSSDIRIGEGVPWIDAALHMKGCLCGGRSPASTATRLATCCSVDFAAGSAPTT